ncbi:MAG: DegT/DnrJ/EryC1/StrS aminotransferase family protein [Candidatus Omnitrophica bacterium]|nr:DegT/DnrJ/EryC1/StrS aminotransferase family protein [Candidatus Omnitrophota bacterium]
MIPITKPFFDAREIKAVTDVIRSGWVTQGPAVKRFEEMFATYAGADYACAVSSCTTALQLALLAAGVGPGDVVITASHSFIATANSIRYCGAEPVFVDIDRDTFNMSPDSLEECLRHDFVNRGGVLFYKKTGRLPVWSRNKQYFSDKKTAGRLAGLMPVHQMGMPCDLKRILKLAGKFKLPVIEDAACAVGSEISFTGGATWEKIGKPHADAACFSFHPRKLITTGEGGMITARQRSFDRTFRLLRHHGMSVSDSVRHHAKKVLFEEYEETGYNYRMSDIHAAVGCEQMKKIEMIIKKRRELARIYAKELATVGWLKAPGEPVYARSNWQSYAVTILDGAPLDQKGLMQHMLNAGISTRRGIMNAHQEKAYGSDIRLPHSEQARDTAVLLPLYHHMRGEDVKTIVKTLKKI